MPHPTHPIEVHQVLPTTAGSALPSGHSGTVYDRLVDERLHSGLLMSDLISHGYHNSIEQHHRVTITPLDARLDGFRRWRSEHADLVRQAEDHRLHEPGSPPAGTPWPCLLCLREVDTLDLAPETQALPMPRFARSWTNVQPLPPRHWRPGTTPRPSTGRQVPGQRTPEETS